MCDISDDVIVSKSAKLILGDNVSIASGVKIIGKGTVIFGDFSKIHSNCFINVQHDHSIVEFGHNTWIGERCVLDGTGKLRAKNNIGIGIASQLYTHIAHGDVMAGCRYMSETEMFIDDDAWFVGMCLVSPVKVGKKSLAMLGSVVAKDMLENSTYAGVPAKDITEKVGRPWVDRSNKEKIEMFKHNISIFCNEFEKKQIAIAACDEFPSYAAYDDITYYNVSTRTYTKKRTKDEIEFMKWFCGWKGRFTPENNLMLTENQ